MLTSSYSHFLPGEVVVPGLVVVVFTVEILVKLSLFAVEDSAGVACPLDTGLGFIVLIITTIKIKAKIRNCLTFTFKKKRDALY